MKVLAVVVIATVASLGACSSEDTAPDPLDVKAAQACQALIDVDNDSTGRAALADKANELSGTKWSVLSDAVLRVATAMSNQDADQLDVAGDQAANECAKIPASAKKAGGYVKK